MSAFLAWPGPSGRESFRFCFGRTLIAAVVCGLATVVGQAAEPKLLKIPADKDWKIEIVPGPAIGPSPSPKFDQAVKQAQAAKAEAASTAATASGVITAGAESAMPAGITSASYTEVYNSIPFRRSEYLANPNYRHEATIELLLGQVRPKTITNVTAPAATCCSPQPMSYLGLINPWGAKNFYYHHSYSRPSSYWLW